MEQTRRLLGFSFLPRKGSAVASRPDAGDLFGKIMKSKLASVSDEN